jgi:hypothetical protein
MTASHRIFLGDLARALARTGSPDGGNWNEIAALLGFTREAPRELSVEPPQVPPPERRAAASAPQSAAPAVRPAEPASDDIGEPVDFDLDRRPADPMPLPQAAAPAVERRRLAPLFLKPLLDPLWERGVLIEAVGTRLAEGSIDVPAAVEAIARGTPLTRPPREIVQSVAKGCQVLLDTGVGMRPFGRDARQVVRAVRRAVGAAHTRVFTFVDCPTRGVLNETYNDEPYTPPNNGAAVLAVTDLCSGGPSSAIRQASQRDWLRIERMIRGAGSTLVILNPYPADSWPAILSTRLPILYWHRGTRAADVRRARRRTR